MHWRLSNDPVVVTTVHLTCFPFHTEHVDWKVCQSEDWNLSSFNDNGEYSVNRIGNDVYPKTLYSFSLEEYHVLMKYSGGGTVYLNGNHLSFVNRIAVYDDMIVIAIHNPTLQVSLDSNGI